MAKSQRIRHHFKHRLKSYGMYTAWTGDHKHIPKIKQFTLEVPARIGVEFGYVLHLQHGRGLELRFEIDHPSWLNADAEIEPVFTGSFFIRHNDFDFFLGDTIWEPWEQKLGPWTLRTWHDEQLLAEKTFNLLDPDLV